MISLLGHSHLLPLSEDEDRRRRFVQARQDVRNLGLGLDELHVLDDVHGGSSGATHVHRHRLNKS